MRVEPNLIKWFGEEFDVDIRPNRDPKTHRERKEFQEHPFIAWDGEGITYDGNDQQAYVLLAASTGDYIKADREQSLSTEDCLDLLLKVEEQNSNAIHIGFGFGYDTNQILNSFSRRNLHGLNNRTKSGKTYWWRGPTRGREYRIKLHPGKLFRVSTGTSPDRNKQEHRENHRYDPFRSITIYDTFGFFQRSFIDVVKSYCPDRLPEITDGKRGRATFSYDQLDFIIRYCLHENGLLVEILDRLRKNFERVGLYLNGWYGPGAVANASFKTHNIRQHMGETPNAVKRASRFAYQGGRFELFRAGYHGGTVYQYDINSAYPAEISKLPSLSAGTWEHVREFEPGSFGVWNCYYRNRSTEREDRYSVYKPEPLFYRDKYGRIIYPYNVQGWYWTPEAELLNELRHKCDIDISEGFVWRGLDMGRNRPFEYYTERYLERLEQKRNKDGAEHATKLELNSGYGKMAQRSGWFQSGDKIPGYHQLEWAGYITSATRAKLFRAYNTNPGGLISFETDAIFSTVPLRVDIGTALGQWSETILDDILYIQSGFYFAHSAHSASGDSAHSASNEIAHYRGFDKNSLDFDKVYKWLESLRTDIWYKCDESDKLFGTTKRFIGFRRALTSRKQHYWRTWEQVPREITIGKEGKRVHMPGCPSCRKNHSWVEKMHYLDITHEGHPYGQSYPHKIPWEDPDFGNQWCEEEDIAILDGHEY